MRRGAPKLSTRKRPDSEMTSVNRSKRKWQHQTRIKNGQGQSLPRDHGVDGRASQAVRHRSYRLSLFFIGSSLSRDFRHPACPGSTIIKCITMHILGEYIVNIIHI